MKSLHNDADARAVLVNNLRWADAWSRRLRLMMSDARGFDGSADARRQNRIDPTPLTYADLDKLRDGLAAVTADITGLLSVVAADESSAQLPADDMASRARALGLRVLQGGRVDPPAAA